MNIIINAVETDDFGPMCLRAPDIFMFIVIKNKSMFDSNQCPAAVFCSVITEFFKYFGGTVPQENNEYS
ncbi:unnamed protein product [Caenorhabditis nigoni]